MSMVTMMTACITIPLVFAPLIAILPTLSKNKTKQSTTKFECGFNPLNKTHPTFSIQFFLMCVMFLILDMEIIILIPFSQSAMNSPFSVAIMLIFVTLLTMGLLEEWKNGAMEWAK